MSPKFERHSGVMERTLGGNLISGFPISQTCDLGKLLNLKLLHPLSIRELLQIFINITFVKINTDKWETASTKFTGGDSWEDRFLREQAAYSKFLQPRRRLARGHNSFTKPSGMDQVPLPQADFRGRRESQTPQADQSRTVLRRKLGTGGGERKCVGVASCRGPPLRFPFGRARWAGARARSFALPTAYSSDGRAGAVT